MTPQVRQSKPTSESSYPTSRIVRRTVSGMSTQALVLISPKTKTTPVFTATSQATRA